MKLRAISLGITLFTTMMLELDASKHLPNLPGWDGKHLSRRGVTSQICS